MWTRAIVASGLGLPLVLFGVAPVRAIDGRAWKDLPEPARAYDIVGVVDAWANGMSGLIWNALNGFCGDK
jgi:hypothetical protein